MNPLGIHLGRMAVEGDKFDGLILPTLTLIVNGISQSIPQPPEKKVCQIQLIFKFSNESKRLPKIPKRQAHFLTFLLKKNAQRTE